MARRYSGAVVVNVVWDDSGVYLCRVSAPEGSEFVEVRPSPMLARRFAADSSEAYDAIAKSALSFSEEPLELRGISLAEHALFEPDGGGWEVSRSSSHDRLFS